MAEPDKVEEVDSQAETPPEATETQRAVAPEVILPYLDAIKAGFDDLVKAGARNSKGDQDKIQTVHDHSVSLGASCATTSAAKKDAGEYVADVVAENIKADDTAVDTIDAMGLPLDRLVNAVNEAFWSLRSKLRKLANIAAGRDADSWDSDWDDSKVPSCEAVYNGYAIGRTGLVFWNIPYTVTMKGVVLAEQSEWKQASQEWVTKNVELWAILQQSERRRDVAGVKVLPNGRLGQYGMLWGSTKERDLYGEFFSKPADDGTGTQGLKSIFDHLGGKVPALYQHAMDGAVKFTPIGTIDTMIVDEIGLWTETQLDLSNQYAVAIQNLAAKKALGTSSGCLPGSRKSTPEGEITQWAIIEVSYTPTPAEPRLRQLGVHEIKSVYADLGLEFSEEAFRRAASIGTEEVRKPSDAETEAELLNLLELELQLEGSL